jgi:hypothetical protein
LVVVAQVRVVPAQTVVRVISKLLRQFVQLVVLLVNQEVLEVLAHTATRYTRAAMVVPVIRGTVVQLAVVAVVRLLAQALTEMMVLILPAMLLLLVVLSLVVVLVVTVPF